MIIPNNWMLDGFSDSETVNLNYVLESLIEDQEGRPGNRDISFCIERKNLPERISYDASFFSSLNRVLSFFTSHVENDFFVLKAQAGIPLFSSVDCIVWFDFALYYTGESADKNLIEGFSEDFASIGCSFSSESKGCRNAVFLNYKFSLPSDYALMSGADVSHEIGVNKKSLSGFRIMVVEDDDTVRLVFQEMLQMAQAEVELASNGAVAVQKFREEDFDLIIMDVEMPVLGGISASKKIRSIETSRANIVRTPIFFLTASPNIIDFDDSFDIGISGILKKPCKPGATIRELSDFLGSKSTNNDPDQGEMSKHVWRFLDLNILDSLKDEGLTILRVLCDTWPIQVEKLESLLKEGNLEDLSRSAHKLKSGCILVSDTSLSRKLDTIQNYSDVGSIQMLGKPLKDIRSLVGKIVAEAEIYLAITQQGTALTVQSNHEKECDHSNA